MLVLARARWPPLLVMFGLIWVTRTSELYSCLLPMCTPLVIVVLSVSATRSALSLGLCCVLVGVAGLRTG